MSAYAAVVLAAGRATRYRAAGGRETSKLLAPFQGRPLVRHVAEAALATAAMPVIVVTGHAADAVTAALADLPLTSVHNPDFGQGLAGSLKLGIEALPSDCPGALVLLADMPAVGRDTIEALMAYALVCPDADAVVPTHAGRCGNPVLLARSLFPAVALLEGDVGAKHLLCAASVRVATLAVPDAGILHDIDLPGDLGPAPFTIF